MDQKDKISRRNFITTTASAGATFAIVPRHVLGGPGFTPPSDMITIANIGCGTQGLREMPEMLTDPRIRIVAVCDPNRYSTDYLDWSPNGIRDGIRRTLEEPEWGASINGIPGGLDVGKEFVDKYYKKFRPGSHQNGCTPYEDYRDLLAQEKDLDVIKIMTPDHLHAAIAIAAMDSGKHVVTHKPIANRLIEGKKVIKKADESGLITHLLAWSEIPEYEVIKRWIDSGVIGQLKEIHNWSYRPVWPQWTSVPSGTPDVPEGFNWDLWLGPVPHRPYHPNYTHNVFRGWYDFGGGSFADMGHYSLFPLFRKLGIHTPPVSAKAYGTTTRTVIQNVCRWVDNDVAFPHSAMFKLQFPKQDNLPAFDLYWYDGGMKPFAPEELEADNRDIPSEGLMFVGDSGKILAGFQGAQPEIIPASAMKQVAKVELPERTRYNRTEEWVKAITSGKQSPGSFQNASTITETINLAAVALRAGKKIEYNSAESRITNDEEANKYLTREYRAGWEL